jgi:NADH-quinone oxidoreductase subunit L
LSDASRFLPLLPLLPGVAALVWILAGSRLGGARVGKLAVGAVGLSFVLAAMVFVNLLLLPAESRSVVAPLFTWIESGSFRAAAALRVDPLSAVMTLVITGIGLLIHIYSLGYMASDRDQSRYFAYLNFFVAAMLLLVLADNLVLMFVGWEGVGLASYLLIGFWFERPSAAEAGKKAFIVNRLGDFGFLLGILLTYVTFGTVTFSEFLPRVGEADSFGALVICLLLLTGAVGKSAQIPLYVWLPDAMEGPTPVSALIHAATMVTAGVYLVARVSPLFVAAPEALVLVGSIGALTALFAASIALVQNDLKRVLAYSTVSQLGYMFLACGVGAFAAGIFHLFTHAFFKALLFLCAGSVMHALAGETDIQRMGGLMRKLPVTAMTFRLGAAAIAGIFPLAGFWSKDAILWSAFQGGHYLLFLAGAAGAFMTAFYMARLWYLVFDGGFRGGAEAEHDLHESPAVMTVPLKLLAGGAVAAGFIGVPHLNWIEGFLAPVLPPGGEEGSLLAELALMAFSLALAVLGIALGRHFYKVKPELPGRLAARAGGLYRLLRDKYRVDETYDAVVVRPLDIVSRAVLWRVIDVGCVDGLARGSGRVVVLTSELARLAQSGSLRVYLFFFLAGTAALVGWMVLG